MSDSDLNPGCTVIHEDNDVFIEFDENGTLLSESIFNKYVPLMDLPQTGATRIKINLWLFIGFLIAGMITIEFRIKTISSEVVAQHELS